MTVTFTNISFDLDIKSDNTAALAVLEELRTLGATNLLHISAQAHITGANADQVAIKLRELESLGVMGNYQMNSLINYIEDLKKAYLR